jgi:hypothetical protein
VAAAPPPLAAAAPAAASAPHVAALVAAAPPLPGPTAINIEDDADTDADTDTEALPDATVVLDSDDEDELKDDGGIQIVTDSEKGKHGMVGKQGDHASAGDKVIVTASNPLVRGTRAEVLGSWSPRRMLVQTKRLMFHAPASLFEPDRPAKRHKPAAASAPVCCVCGKEQSPKQSGPQTLHQASNGMHRHGQCDDGQSIYMYVPLTNANIHACFNYFKGFVRRHFGIKELDNASCVHHGKFFLVYEDQPVMNFNGLAMKDSGYKNEGDVMRWLSRNRGGLVDSLCTRHQAFDLNCAKWES